LYFWLLTREERGGEERFISSLRPKGNDITDIYIYIYYLIIFLIKDKRRTKQNGEHKELTREREREKRAL
jgi:hypothetical protein